MFFWVTMVDICRKIKSFSPLYPSLLLLVILFTFSFNYGRFMHIIQNIRTKKTFCWRFSSYTRKLLSVWLQASVKLNVWIKPSHWTTDVLITSQMNLNIVNWAILPCKLQYNTRNQKVKDKLLWDWFHLQVKSVKGDRPAGRPGMVFLSPEDGSRSPAATGCC